MSLKHLLVHLDGGPRAVVRLDLAIALAQKYGARLTGLFAQSETSGPSLVARRASDHLRETAQKIQSLFAIKTAEARIPGQWWQLGHGEYSHVVGETVFCCRYADLAIIGQHDPNTEGNKVPHELVEEIILQSGRPALVIPYTGDYPSFGQRVVVAWNGSREAARALNDAIPLMQHASSVVVLALHEHHPSNDDDVVPPVDIAAHLAAHGIRAHLERMVVEGMAPMDVVLSRCSDESADLLVMGGHGNYGFPFLHRGGNTRHILRQMTLPVLMSN
mgnify:CR=1 FL=1